MDTVQSGFCPVPGTALYYEVSGDGPPVVFLHGNPAELSVWETQADWFARKHRVIRYDLRGYGRSQPASVPYSHAGDLALLLDHLGLDRAYLVGWSMGGGVAVNFALTHPQRVRGLVLVDSSLGGYSFSEGLTASFAAINGNVVREKGLEAAREKLLNHPLLEQAMKRPESARLMRASLGVYSGWHWLNPDPGVPLEPPAYARLEEIRVPTLVMYGELDMPDFIDIARLLGLRIPGAQMLSFPEAGHCLPVEEPEPFNQAIEEFIADIESVTP